MSVDTSEKTPHNLTVSLMEALQIFGQLNDGDSTDTKKVREGVGKTLVAMKSIVAQGQDSATYAHLAQEFYSNDLLRVILQELRHFDRESRRDVAYILGQLLRRQIGARVPTVDYINTKSESLFVLLRGYENPEIALDCGIMLRECVRYAPLTKTIQTEDGFYRLFDYIELSQHDIANDAFATLKEILQHSVSTKFLEENYDRIFERYQKLLHLENDVLCHKAVKLLGDLLLDPNNFVVMTKYTNNSDNLKLIIELLQDERNIVSLEAFNVFKVIAANPNKTRPVIELLLQDRDQLLDVLSKLGANQPMNEQFSDEKDYVMAQLKELKSTDD